MAITLIAGSGNSTVADVTWTSTTTSVGVNGATWTDCGLSATITPKSTNSKILVVVTLPIYSQASDSQSAGARILRGATAVWTANRFLVNALNANVGVNYMQPIMYLDSPATTGATTYKIQFIETANAGIDYAVYCPAAATTASMQLIEIAND